MRKIAYRVSTENGNEFITNDYNKAKANGNYIEETILTEVDPTPEKRKEMMFAHADRLKEKRG